MVSIIIATYNAAETISRALDSVVNQTFQDWECIIVDGASKDNTAKIIKSYVKRDSRFRYISEPDKGIYDAFNKGWQMAKGDWIYYLGADDVLIPSSFTNFPFDCDDDIAIISGSIERISKTGKRQIIKPHGFEGSHQGQITRKNILEKLNGFDLKYRIVGDFELNTRIQLAGYRVKNVDSVVALFSAGGTSEQYKNLLKTTKERYKVFCKNPNYKHPFVEAVYSYIINVMYILYAKIYKTFINKSC